MKARQLCLLACSGILGGLPLSLGAQSVMAPPKNAPVVWVDHTLQLGDNLARLVLEELVLPANKDQALRDWQKGNPGVSLTELRPGQNLRIPQPWLRPTHARASRVVCTGSRWPSVNGRPLQLGDTVSEGDTVDIPAGCQTDFLFEDGSRLVLPNAARFKIITLRRDLQRKVPDVRIELLSGRANAQVSKQRPNGAVFEIRTPGAMTAVRGTEFQVAFVPETQISLTEVLDGEVRNQGQQDPQAQVLARLQGVATNAQGQGQGVEALPEPPRLERFDAIDDQRLRLQFQAVPRAARYAFARDAAVNTPGQTADPGSPAAEHILPAPSNDLAVVLAAQSQTTSGLLGPQQRLAFCHSPAMKLCKVLFDASAAGDQAVQLEMLVEEGGRKTAFYHNMNLRFADRKFVVDGVPEGVYHWVLRYPMPASSPLEAPRMVQESGVFDLRLTPAQVPVKP